jgi:Colicin V production protein
MIFAIIILALIGVVTFFHYTQGFWSATLSAIVAILAAVLAVSYHESVVDTLLKGKMADQANAIALVGVFGLTYLILRTIFDKAVPGNLRLPVILDKAGAGIMGFIAAIFSVGVVAVAAQTMPFGVDVGGYTRYRLSDDREVAVAITGKQQHQDVPISNQLDEDAFSDETRKGLLLPVDQWVVSTVSHLSDGGSLSGKRALRDVHPDYLDEMFAQRLGIQPGGKLVATNAAGKKQVEVKGLFRAPDQLPQLDADLANSRPNNKVVKWPEPKKGEMILVVRVGFNSGTGDGSKAPAYVRFSPGSIRLLVKSEEDGPKNYFPIGTIEGGTTLFANRIDDFLFTSEGSSVDAAFLVKEADVLEGKENKIKEGTFIEVKRLARENLGGKKVESGIGPDKSVNVIRKPAVGAAAAKSAAPAAAPEGEEPKSDLAKIKKGAAEKKAATEKEAPPAP